MCVGGGGGWKGVAIVVVLCVYMCRFGLTFFIMHSVACVCVCLVRNATIFFVVVFPRKGKIKPPPNASEVTSFPSILFEFILFHDVRLANGWNWDCGWGREEAGKLFYLLIS